MHGRHRLGDRPQLRRLRPAGQRRDHASCTRARPTIPEPDRFWRMIEKHQVNIFYTAPTAIRAFVRWGEQWPRKHDLSSLRLLGTVGEPINPEAWMWYRAVIGGGRCPIVDTWWQTETGAIMITPLPGRHPDQARLGHAALLRRRRRRRGQGRPAGAAGRGRLPRHQASPGPRCCAPSTRTPTATSSKYWKRFPGIYFTGDGARRDADGYFWIMGRVDDVINVAGHRLGTMEVESALVSHAKVAEAAVVGRPDELKGQALVAFVTPKGGLKADDALRAELKEHVVQGDRRHRAAGRDPLHRRAAQDAQRQDHAPAAARHRGGQGDGRRHHHARGLLRPGQAARGGGVETGS